MDTTPRVEPTYVLGTGPAELERLDHQAAVIAPATRVLLQAAGIERGMRVLDLGTGLGHVARMVAELVGPDGAVVGVDRSSDALTVARKRSAEAGLTNITFVDSDVRSWQAPSRFDAIVGRLVLFHLPDPTAVVVHHRQNLRDGGVFAAIDFDIGSCRSDPPTPLATSALTWIMQAFSAAGAAPRIGARLASILEAAGMQRVTTFGVQGYLQPNDPAGPAMLAGVVRSLASVIVQHGIATEDELDLPTLEPRIAEQLRSASAVLLPPTVVGAWGRAQA